MSSLAKIVLYLVAVVLLAALLSPVVFWAIQASSSHPVVGSLADHPFYRVFSRTLQITAIVLLVPMLFWVRIRNLGQLGLQRDPDRWRHLLVGFALSILPVILLGALYLFLDFYRIRKDLPVGGIFRIASTAVLVAMLEEFVFRGVLLGLAVQAFGKVRAVIVVSLVFAVVHFLRAGKEATETVTWLSGFHQLAGFGDGLPPVQLFLLGFLSLFVAGLILGYGALQTRALWLPIGLHAGWITAQQGLQWWARYRIKPPESFLPWVGPNLVSGAVPTGLLPVLALLLTGLAVFLYLRRARNPVAR